MYMTHLSRSNSNTISIKIWFSCPDWNGLLSVLCFLCIVTLRQHTEPLCLHYHRSVCLSHKTPSKMNILSSDLTHRRGKIVQRKKDFTRCWERMWESWIVLWLKAKQTRRREGRQSFWSHTAKFKPSPITWWVSHLNSLSLDFFLWKKGVITVDSQRDSKR